VRRSGDPRPRRRFALFRKKRAKKYKNAPKTYYNFNKSLSKLVVFGVLFLKNLLRFWRAFFEKAQKN
jgi:hypothetical protein